MYKHKINEENIEKSFKNFLTLFANIILTVLAKKKVIENKNKRALFLFSQCSMIRRSQTIGPSEHSCRKAGTRLLYLINNKIFCLYISLFSFFFPFITHKSIINCPESFFSPRLRPQTPHIRRCSFPKPHQSSLPGSHEQQFS